MIRKEDQILPYDEVVGSSKRYYVYAIYLPHKNIPVYIGKGTKNRYKSYANDTPKRTNHTNRILAKKLQELKEIGKKYMVLILFETDDEQQALDTEEFYISYYGRVCNKSGVLYNFEPGGMVGLKENPSIRRAVYVRGFIFPGVRIALDALRLHSNVFKSLIEEGYAAYLDNEDQISNLKTIEDTPQHSIKGSKLAQNARAIEINGVTYSSTTQAAKEFGYTTGSSLLYYLNRNKDKYQFTLFESKRKKYKAGPRPIEIDGKYYGSLKEAAPDFGFQHGNHLMRYLKKSDHVYKLYEPEPSRINSSKPKPISINGVLYESRKEAAKEFGYKSPKSFVNFLRRGNHNHEVTFH